MQLKVGLKRRESMGSPFQSLDTAQSLPRSTSILRTSAAAATRAGLKAPLALLGLSALTACGPSETAPVVPLDPVRVALAQAGAAEPPLDPRGTTGFAAVQPGAWTTLPGERTAVFGEGGQRALLSLACEGLASGSPRLIVTRYAPAERGAEALFAIQGNRRILRLPVRAVGLRAGVRAWRGALVPGDERADVFLGEAIAATVPGGGRLTLPAMGEARAVIDECRAAASDNPSGRGLVAPGAPAPLPGSG
jgi:hypothetical protein